MRLDLHQDRFVRIKDALQELLRKHVELTTRWQWRLIGYLMLLPTVAVVFLLTFGLQHLVGQLVLEDGILLLAVSIIAFLWGFGPALLLVAFGMIMLDFWFIGPYGQLSLTRWPDILQELPFGVAAIAIGLLSFQQAKGWLNTQATTRQLAA